MRKMSKTLVILALLALVFSVPALAVKDADVDWGKNAKDGTWGFVYYLPNDPDGGFVDEGEITPYLRMRKDGPWNYTIKGAYITDGQEVNTTIGTRLGIDYSPYIAKFHGDNRIIGIRVHPFMFDLGVGSLEVDGMYAFSAIGADNADFWSPGALASRKSDLLFGLKGDFDIADLALALTVISTENTVDPEVLYDYHVNASAETEFNIMDGLTLTGLVAYYGLDSDWLYEVTGEYEVLPEMLWVRAGHRNSSDFDEGIAEAVGGFDVSDDKQRYVEKLDPIEDIYKRDFSINIGATVEFDYEFTRNKIDIDYDTTNPDGRGDLDDLFKIVADTDAAGFNIWQEFSMLLPDDNTTARTSTIFDDGASRLDYRIKFETPEYDLPVPMLDRVFAVGRVNFDWDNNYLADSRSQTIVAGEIGVEQDIWRLEGMTFGARVGYDMAGGSDAPEVDPIKFAIIARYEAPNGIKFRLEYQNSADYADDTTFVHHEELYKRYAPVRFYDNSVFDGIRLTVGFPL